MLTEALISPADLSQEQKDFFNACEKGSIEVAEVLIKRVNVNQRNGDETPFSIACRNRHISIIKLLLADARTDVNAGRESPLFISCKQPNNTEILTLLLADNRIKINVPDKETRSTPFYALFRQDDTQQYLLCSPDITLDKVISAFFIKGFEAFPHLLNKPVSAEMLTELGSFLGFSDNEPRLLRVRAVGQAIIVELYNDGPEEYFPQIATVHNFRIRNFRCLLEAAQQEATLQFITGLFCLTVFACDGYVRLSSAISETNPAEKKAQRFFYIAQKLAIELQMVLCNRAGSKNKNSISLKDIEIGFHKRAAEFNQSEVANINSALLVLFNTNDLSVPHGAEMSASNKTQKDEAIKKRIALIFQIRLAAENCKTIIVTPPPVLHCRYYIPLQRYAEELARCKAIITNADELLRNSAFCSGGKISTEKLISFGEFYAEMLRTLSESLLKGGKLFKSEAFLNTHLIKLYDDNASLFMGQSNTNAKSDTDKIECIIRELSMIVDMSSTLKTSYVTFSAKS